MTLNFVISSLIVGTFKSACMTLLDIYHGAFTIARRTLFCDLCNISMLELLALPQRGIPYVQILDTGPQNVRSHSNPTAMSHSEARSLKLSLMSAN